MKTIFKDIFWLIKNLLALPFVSVIFPDSRFLFSYRIISGAPAAKRSPIPILGNGREPMK